MSRHNVVKDWRRAAWGLRCVMTIATYLIAWDVADQYRLQRVGKRVKGWKATGQKSVAECWLTPPQRDRLLGDVSAEMDAGADRLLALRLDPRCEILTFGQARRTTPGLFLVV